MDQSDISLLRLASQHVSGKQLTSPQAIITWMGAMQAQDFPMAKWAIGLRLPGSTDALVEAAFDKGAILRTHLLRPTWHFVTPQDIHWMLDLAAPNIRAGQRSRERDLELTGDVYAKSNRIIEKALSQHGQLPREALILELNRAGITTDQNRASHLLMGAELDQVICSGASLRGKPAYALLADKVPDPRRLAKEEALAELARRYFTSRSPATLQDFTWWSGLPAREARLALELVNSEFSSVNINDLTYWINPQFTGHEPKRSEAQLLPTYDELIISYSDRGALIPTELEKHMKEISNRGIFWPIIISNGQVVGTWKRSIKKKSIHVEIQPFSPLPPSVMASVEQVAHRYADFNAKELEFNQAPLES